MIRIIGLFILVFIIIIGCEHKVDKFYKHGKLVSYRYIKRKTKEFDGPTVELFSNGQIFSYEQYKDGVLDGNSFVFNYFGDTVLHVVYSNGLIWDVLIYRTRDGKDLDFGKVRGGNGFIKMYSFAGELTGKGQIIDGYKEGIWYFFNQGELDDSAFCKKGQISYYGIDLYYYGNYIYPNDQTRSYFMENIIEK